MISKVERLRVYNNKILQWLIEPFIFLRLVKLSLENPDTLDKSHSDVSLNIGRL